MWKPQRMLKGIDPITGSAGAAALSTVLTQHIASRYVKSELSSEILCWLLLPLLFQLARPRDIGRFGTIPKPQPQSKSRPISSRFLWIAAASIAIASCYKAEIGVIGLLVISTPQERHTQTNGGRDVASIDSASFDSWESSPIWVANFKKPWFAHLIPPRPHSLGNNFGSFVCRSYPFKLEIKYSGTCRISHSNCCFVTPLYYTHT